MVAVHMGVPFFRGPHLGPPNLMVVRFSFKATERRVSSSLDEPPIFLGVVSPFFSAIILFKNLPFPRVFGRFAKKDPWKEWKWKLPPKKIEGFLDVPHRDFLLVSP